MSAASRKPFLGVLAILAVALALAAGITVAVVKGLHLPTRQDSPRGAR
jgi:hypothetical protein